ncbi:STAS domain-containing protein [Streptomyces cellostaticus]|uniref:STAS domain-containing protein n=1 Tax=Streptomyces TaxID=1883 RepID=UPI0020266C1C|nr:STAS domain-containing protein [Streptomyces cellostaticus]
MTEVTETLDVTVRYAGDSTAVVHVSGDVDLHTAATLRAHALAVVNEGVPNLVLDLAGVDFVDSTGLSAFIGLLHTTQQAGGSLRLADVPDRLTRMVTMTGISELMPIHPTVADALAGGTADNAPGRAGEGAGAGG